MDIELTKADLCTVKIVNREGKLPETIRGVEEALNM
jgi:hypothetical protein